MALRLFQIRRGQTRRDRRHRHRVVSQFLMRHHRQQRAIDAARISHQHAPHVAHDLPQGIFFDLIHLVLPLMNAAQL